MEITAEHSFTKRVDEALKAYSPCKTTAYLTTSKIVFFIVVGGGLGLLMATSFTVMPNWLKYGVGLGAPIPLSIISFILYSKGKSREGIHRQVVEAKQFTDIKNVCPLSEGERIFPDLRIYTDKMIGVSQKCSPTTHALKRTLDKYGLDAPAATIAQILRDSDQRIDGVSGEILRNNVREEILCNKVRGEIAHNKREHLNNKDYATYKKTSLELLQKAYVKTGPLFAHLHYVPGEVKLSENDWSDYFGRYTKRLELAYRQLQQACRVYTLTDRHFLPEGPFTEISKYLADAEHTIVQACAQTPEDHTKQEMEEWKKQLEIAIYKAHVLDYKLNKVWKRKHWSERVRVTRAVLDVREQEAIKMQLKRFHQSVLKQPKAEWCGLYARFVKNIDPEGYDKISDKTDPIYFRRFLDTQEHLDFLKIDTALEKEGHWNMKELAKRFKSPALAKETSLRVPIERCRQNLEKIEGRLKNSSSLEEYKAALKELMQLKAGKMKVVKNFLSSDGRITRLAKMGLVRKKRLLDPQKGVYIFKNDSPAIRQQKILMKRHFEQLTRQDMSVLRTYRFVQIFFPIMGAALFFSGYFLKSHYASIAFFGGSIVMIGGGAAAHSYAESMLEKKRILQLRERRWTQGHRRVHGEAAEAAKKKYDRWGIDGDLAVCSAIVKGRIQPISRWNRFCDKFMTASKGKGIFSRAEIEAALLHPAQRHYHALRRHGAISAEVLRLAKQASEEELLKEGLREIV